MSRNDQRNHEPFPLDWDAWRMEWSHWLLSARRRGILKPCTFKFPDKNMLADDVLGVWSSNGRNVELSEVTFPDLSGARPRRGDVRYVGITFGDGAGMWTPENGIVATFAELEAELAR